MYPFFNPRKIVSNANFFTKHIYIYCRVTNRNPNPDRIGYGPNKPNTINL